MAHFIDQGSLIPYLKSEAETFYLSLTSFSDSPDDYAGSTNSLPFNIISDQATFTKVSSAALKGDMGHEILPLLLLIQKDHYSIDKEISISFTNISVGKQWQGLLSHYARAKTAAKAFILKDQTDQKGLFLPFQPIFFCSLKNVFFPPFCPYCGQPLSLCRNDQILKENGLNAYSESLNRYLFCEHCIKFGGSVEFYAYEREVQEPDHILDRTGLISKMGAFKSSSDLKNTEIPCFNCDQQPKCYGAERLALSRISVFAFYPFYMLIFSADKISSQDYKKIISGEIFLNLEEINAGKDKSLVRVLKTIKSRWQEEMRTLTKTPETQINETQSNLVREAASEVDLAATHVFTDKELKRIKTQLSKIPDSEQALEKTRIISSKKPHADNGFDPYEGDLEKTHILMPRTANVKSQRTTMSNESEHLSQEKSPKNSSDIEKTVIITPVKNTKNKNK